MNKRAVFLLTEWIIAFTLIIIYIHVSYFSNANFTPLEAHEQSERTYHYGPSTIVREVEYENVKFYLGTYKDQWFSANFAVKRGLKWYPGSGVGGIPIQDDKKISYNWGMSTINDELMLARLFGYVTDPNIVQVELGVSYFKEDGNEDGKVDKWIQQDVEDSMFLFIWNEVDYLYSYNFALRGLDKNGNIIFEKEA